MYIYILYCIIYIMFFFSIMGFYFYQLLHVDVLIFGGVLLQEGTLRWEARRGRPLDILSHSTYVNMYIHRIRYGLLEVWSK